MKFSENSDKAADFLRKAVPMMVKYKIVPNPLNYTLWYSYFSNVFPLLNKELDQAIERYGTCPPAIAESLFLQHINQTDSDEKKQLVKFQKDLSHVVKELSESLDQTTQQTTDYAQALMGNLNDLTGQKLDDTLTPVLGEVSVNAKAICDANEKFQGQLLAAQAEINSLKSELENSKKDANTDPLTGLFNRRVLESIYQQFVDNSKDDMNFSLIIMDIDRFKVFNDTHGHLMGDQILQFVGQLLKKECKESVVPIRFGGEEFALLCPYSTLQQAQDIAEKIRIKLASVPFSNKRTGQTIPPITASFGVAIKQQNDILTQVIERADQALYAAKEAGRNQVKVASN